MAPSPYHLFSLDTATCLADLTCLTDAQAIEGSSEGWNQLAASFQADIAQQPELLIGGELREYQMHVKDNLCSCSKCGYASFRFLASICSHLH